MYTLLLRTIITYILLVGAMKVMGKRQLGELELSEFTITMLLSELASTPISDSSIPITFSIVPIIVLISLEMIVSFISIKSRKIKKLFGGSPSFIIKKGKLCKNEMEKVRISIDELLSQLRIKNIFDLSEVEYAILEENGQLSVVPKAYARSVTLDDLNIQSKEKGIAHTIIADGQISDFNLSLSGHNKKWLMKQLKLRNCKLKDVFLFTIDDSENIYIIKNGDLI